MKDWHVQNWDKEFGLPGANGLSCGGYRLVHHCISDPDPDPLLPAWDWHVCVYRPMWGWYCPACGDVAPEEIEFVADLANCIRYERQDIDE